MSETEFVRLTVKQVAAEIGESVHTVRNWIRDFRPYLHLVKSEGGYNLFTKDSLEVIQSIKKKYRDQGLSTKQIQAILSGAVLPVEEEKSDYEKLSVRLERHEAALLEILRLQREQNEMIERSLRARDEKLMIVMRELREAKHKKGLVYRLVSRLSRKKSFKGEISP